MDLKKGEKVETWMFRAPYEWLSLAVSLLLIIGLGYLFAQLDWIYLLIIGVTIIYVWLLQFQYLGSAVRVHKDQFPEIYEIFKDHAKRLGISRAVLYIEQDPYLNAYALGINRCVVVLSSALVEQLDEKELSFVIGHELGHYKAGHTKISTIFNPPQLPGFLKMFTNSVFLFWNRRQEYTSDRCGLVLTKDFDSAASALIKLSIGGNLYKKMDVNSYLSQIVTANSSVVGLSELALSHPLITNRIKNLRLFWKQNFVKSS